MQTRYFLEMVFYFGLVVFFQYRLLVFTEAWNQMLLGFLEMHAVTTEYYDLPEE